MNLRVYLAQQLSPRTRSICQDKIQPNWPNSRSEFANWVASGFKAHGLRPNSIHRHKLYNPLIAAITFSSISPLSSELVPLPTLLLSLCSSAHLLCFPYLSPSLEKHDQNSRFSVYLNKNFIIYGTDQLGGADSFKNYLIGDNLPVDSFRRSFLPRSTSPKLLFSTSKIQEMKSIFHAIDNSSMETMFKEALGDCERAPAPDETKRCVGSAEDMIDFAISVLGRNVVVRTTEGVEGSKKKVMIGTVKGINGGKVTKSVSCHQSLFPYLLYYCHSVPKVRVYEADIMDPKTKSKINHGVAICHLDTSAWSASHGAFAALGSSPGKIEVCHWIFENDMTWTTAD